MRILVAKAEKRAREEGKEILFKIGIQIDPERLELFKRRKATKEADSASPSAETLANITYVMPGSTPSSLPPAAVQDNSDIEINTPMGNVPPSAVEHVDAFSPDSSEFQTDSLHLHLKDNVLSIPV